MMRTFDYHIPNLLLFCYIFALQAENCTTDVDSSGKDKRQAQTVHSVLQLAYTPPCTKRSPRRRYLPMEHQPINRK